MRVLKGGGGEGSLTKMLVFSPLFGHKAMLVFLEFRLKHVSHSSVDASWRHPSRPHDHTRV